MYNAIHIRLCVQSNSHTDDRLLFQSSVLLIYHTRGARGRDLYSFHDQILPSPSEPNEYQKILIHSPNTTTNDVEMHHRERQLLILEVFFFSSSHVIFCSMAFSRRRLRVK